MIKSDWRSGIPLNRIQYVTSYPKRLFNQASNFFGIHKWSRRFGVLVPTIFIVLLTLNLAFYSNLTPSKSPTLTSELVRHTLDLPVFTHGAFRIKGKERYSTVYCRMHQRNTGAQCHLTNVAIHENTIRFYEDPANPVDYITNRIESAFPTKDFLDIRAGAVNKGPTNMQIIRIKGPIPEDAQYAEPALSVLIDPFWPESLGHVLVDDLFGAFSVLLDLGLPCRQVHLTLFRGCHDYGFTADQVQSCLGSYSEKIIGLSGSYKPIYLSHRNPYNTTTEEYRDSVRARQLITNGKGLFYQNLVGGTTDYALYAQHWTRNDHTMIWHLYRETYLENMGLINVKAHEQHILIFKKTGKRSISNYDTVIEVANLFGVKVTVLEYLGRNWRQEMEIMAMTSVLFSVPGGISFGAAFMNQETVTVITDSWDYIKNSSFPFEGYWWERAEFFQSMDYLLDYEEVIFPNLDPEWSPQQKKDVVMNHLQLNLNRNKLINIFCRALRLAEKSFKWSDSFNKKPCIKDE